MKTTLIAIFGLATILMVGCTTLNNRRDTIYWFPRLISQNKEFQLKVGFFSTALYEDPGFERSTHSFHYSGKKGSYFEGITVWANGPDKEGDRLIGISYPKDMENLESVKKVQALMVECIGEEFMQYAEVKEEIKSHRE